MGGVQLRRVSVCGQYLFKGGGGGGGGVSV